MLPKNARTRETDTDVESARLASKASNCQAASGTRSEVATTSCNLFMLCSLILSQEDDAGRGAKSHASGGPQGFVPGDDALKRTCRSFACLIT